MHYCSFLHFDNLLKLYENVFDFRKYTLKYLGLKGKISLVSVCARAQLCLTLCNPMDCSSPGSSVHEISQARMLEWVAISFSSGFSWPRVQTHISLYILHWQAGSLPAELPGKPQNMSRVLLLSSISELNSTYVCVMGRRERRDGRGKGTKEGNGGQA